MSFITYIHIMEMCMLSTSLMYWFLYVNVRSLQTYLTGSFCPPWWFTVPQVWEQLTILPLTLKITQFEGNVQDGIQTRTFNTSIA